MTIEDYFDQYPLMKVLTFMQYQVGHDVYDYDFDVDDEVEEVFKQWTGVLKELEQREGWRSGKHEGDCTNVPASCYRCVIESLASKAYQVLIRFDSMTSIPMPPYTDPRYKTV